MKPLDIPVVFIYKVAAMQNRSLSDNSSRWNSFPDLWYSKANRAIDK